MMTRKRILIGIGSLVLLLLPFVGGQWISPLDGITGNESVRFILLHLRIPRVILALLAGGGLALAGLVFQALFRNPLASPYTLGVATGASLMVVLFLQFFQYSSLLASSGLVLFAFTGSNISMVLIYLLSRKYGQILPSRMIIAGIALNYFFSGIISLILYYSRHTDIFQIFRWMMGGLDIVGYRVLFFLIPVMVLISLLLFLMVKPIAIMGTSEEFAYGKGVDVRKYRKAIFWIVSLLTASIVAFTGPIAFVGLMIPHFSRMLFGADLRKIFFPTFWLGGIFLAVVDTIGRTLFYPLDFPVGILTGLLGGPFFVWLIYREKKVRFF